MPELVCFENWKGKKVLEVGCGIGTDLIQFLRAGADVYGIDLPERSVALAKKRLSLYGFDPMQISHVDAEGLKFPDNHFDLVYSWGVLHHTPNIEKAISEIHRVLKPEGNICIMLYHKPSLVVLQLYLLNGLFKMKPFRDVDEIIANHLESPGTRAFTRKQTENLFQRFNNLSIQTVVTRYDLRYFRDRHKRDKYFPDWFRKFIPNCLGWYIVIKGKK